ncbi:MAG: hypothetical protein O7G88_06125, partial [bacterium]|nr:hypothetical protein [bacterium]
QLQHQRQAALWNQARLLPFLLLGAPNVEQAMQAHQRFYGNRPQPMSGDSWHWDPLRREIRSSLFGSAMQPKLPDTTASQPLESGPFSNTKHLDLSFRLEDEGVRVVLEIMPR